MGARPVPRAAAAAPVVSGQNQVSKYHMCSKGIPYGEGGGRLPQPPSQAASPPLPALPHFQKCQAGGGVASARRASSLRRWMRLRSAMR